MIDIWCQWDSNITHWIISEYPWSLRLLEVILHSSSKHNVVIFKDNQTPLFCHPLSYHFYELLTFIHSIHNLERTQFVYVKLFDKSLKNELSIKSWCTCFHNSIIFLHSYEWISFSVFCSSLIPFHKYITFCFDWQDNHLCPFP